MPSTVTIRSKAKAHHVTQRGARPGRGEGMPKGNPFKGTPFEGMFPDGIEDFNPHDTPHAKAWAPA